MQEYRNLLLSAFAFSLLAGCSSDDGSGGAVGVGDEAVDGVGGSAAGNEPSQAAGGMSQNAEPGTGGDYMGPDPATGGSAPASGGVQNGAGGTENKPLPEPGTADEEHCAAQDSWGAASIAFEEEVLVIVNQKRAEGANCGGEDFGPTHPLVLDPALVCAARLHSKDMADQDYFSHNSLDGRSPFDRMEAAGFEFSSAGENIAAGQETPEHAMESWMSSPGHCKGIMNPDFEFIGVGHYELDGYHLWTQTFGTPPNW